jgi:hypothetical protein
MLIAVLIIFLVLICGLGGYFLFRKIQLSQRISQIYQLNLHAVPLARALLFACVPEHNLFLDTTYLQKNKQSGLYYQVPIHAMALTRGGIVVFQYLQTPEKLITTEGTQWNLKSGPTITAIPNPFLRMELQARTLLSMLKQNDLNQVPVHAYVILLNDQTQVLQGREDVIFANDIPNIIQKYDHSKLISSFQMRKISNMLTAYQFQSQTVQNKKA